MTDLYSVEIAYTLGDEPQREIIQENVPGDSVRDALDRSRDDQVEKTMAFYKRVGGFVPYSANLRIGGDGMILNLDLVAGDVKVRCAYYGLEHVTH